MRAMRGVRALLAAVGTLGGVAALVVVAAGPAGADPGNQTSGGAVAVGGSVASGEATAVNGSTASGDAVAIDGSTASGCSTAIDGSTASGGDCKPAHEIECPQPSNLVVFPSGRSECVFPEGDAPARREAVGGGAPAARLAFTGPGGTSTATLAVAAGAALLVGGALVTATSGRRRSALQG